MSKKLTTSTKAAKRAIVKGVKAAQKHRPKKYMTQADFDRTTGFIATQLLLGGGRGLHRALGGRGGCR